MVGFSTFSAKHVYACDCDTAALAAQYGKTREEILMQKYGGTSLWIP